MDIYNSQYIHNVHSVSTPHFRSVSAQSPVETNRVSTPIRDEISLSRESQSMLATSSVSDSSSAAPRLDLINRIRSEIAAGTYDTPEKFETALSRLLGAR